MAQRIQTTSDPMARVAKTATVLALATSIALSSCVYDYWNSGNNGYDNGNGGSVTLAFSPRFGNHAETRAETYNDTWTEFANFFGGAAQVEDIFEDDGDMAGFGRAADRTISTFRVLIYNSAGTTAAGNLVQKGTRHWNFAFTWSPTDPNLQPPFEIQVVPGTYDFVFIANEQTLAGTLGSQYASTPYIATLAQLQTLTLAHGASADIHNSKTIPMVTVVRNVEVSGKNKVAYTDPDTGTNVAWPQNGGSTWNVRMRRAAVRLSFGIDMGAAQYEAWLRYHNGNVDELKVGIANLKSKNYLLPGIPNENIDSTPFAVQEIGVTTNTTATSVTGKMKLKSDGGAFVFIDRLIYPELLLATPDDNQAAKAKAVRAYLNFDYGNRLEQKDILLHYPAPEGDDNVWGYSLPRNTWVWAKAGVHTDITTTVRVVPWGETELDPIPTQHNLTTDRSGFIFRHMASNDRMEIFTDHPDGWHIESVSHEWITAPVAGTTVGSTQTNNVISVSVGEHTGSSVREGNFVIRSGNLKKIIKITQLPAIFNITDTAPPSDVSMYVGAFWRANQYGERLIRTARPTSGSTSELDGPWTAYVVEGDDWIQLDTRPSDDQNAGSESAIPGNAAGFDVAHRVPGYETTVRGEMSATVPQIYFRIGLNGAYTPTPDKPARYGMVLLVYTQSGTTAYRRIWVRQGENADYMMRPEDAIVGGDLPITQVDGKIRPLAVKLSPYNLTVPDFANGNNGTQQTSEIAPGQGTFTEWPSQAGAFFPWGHKTSADAGKIIAYNPASANTSYPSSGWENGNSSNWALLDQKYESCPTNADGVKFRRFIDGNPYLPNSQLTVDVNWTEVQQSLFVNAGQNSVYQQVYPTASNYAWGKYADGYFDRKDANSNVVSAGGYNVAYIGGLLFNPTTCHSLFFPAAGLVRQPYFNGQASVSLYWSSSTVYNDRRALAIMYYTGLIQHEPTNSGALIRCVDGPTRSIPGLIHTTPGMIGIRHSDLGKDPATFSLTVMGSNKYLTDPDFKDLPFVTNNRANFADEPVYAVYFKWGSTIAVLGSQTGVTTFVDSDVVWWPTNSVEINYTRPTTFSWGHDRFRPATPTSATSGTAAAAGNRIPAFNDTEGWGDPCKLVDGGTATNPSLWRTPTGGPWTSTELISGTYYPFGYQRGDYAYEDETQPANSPITWTAQRARPNGQNAVTKWDETRKGAISDDGDFFLPATGFRMGGNTNSASPKDGSGDMELLGGRGGAYWTSSTTNNSGSYNITTGSFSAGGVTYAGFSNYNNNYMGLCLRIYSNIVSPAKDLYYSYAIPIRCVPAN